MIRRICIFAALCTVAAVAYGQQASIVKDVLIRGNVRVSKEAILAAMRTKAGKPLVQDDLGRDKKSLEDLGFFSAVDVEATPSDLNAYQVTVDLQEWPVIKEFKITGNTVVTREEILKALTMKVGDVFNLNARHSSVDAIAAAYDKKHYALAGIDDFAPLTDSPGTINIVIVELKVGTVSTQGNVRTKDWVMRRLIKTRAGDVYNEDKWAKDVTRIHNTNWFDSVQAKREDISPEPGKVNRNLIAEVKEAKTGQFNVGVQMDPDTSLAGLIRLSENNLYGTGKSVALNLTQAISGGGPSVDLSYTNPFYDAKDTVFQTSIYSHLVYRFGTSFFGTSSPINSSTQYYERHSGLSLGWQRPITDQVSLGFSGRVENVTTANTGATPLNSFVQQDGDMGMLSFSATRDRRDTIIDTSRGDFSRVIFEPGYSDITRVGGATANNDILGSNFFTRTTMEYRKYWSPGQKPRDLDVEAARRVIAVRAKYGFINGKVPYFDQFFAGGPDSLRGYDPDRFWGKDSILLSAEYRHPIQKSFDLIFFVDYGGAWGGYGTVNDYTQSRTFQMHLGYGPGLSFKTPFGQICVDLGFNENGKTQPDFRIGNSF
ncbi:MAG: BamA/TamA family outer membrane protein [Fimbriimonas sp.]|nr:BamA/TamA family outer membrane protein [Fimbriimonas sp.]